MATVIERVGPERAWIGTVLTLAVALAAGVLAFPKVVYDEFIWTHFWGPIVADAHGSYCASLVSGGTQFYESSAACSTAPGAVAYPGYTFTSEVGYAVTLILALVGVIFLLRRLDVGRDRRFFFSLIPFMFFGGALRVVEDANTAIPPGVKETIPYPLNTLIISPIIYFVMFFITLAALLVSLWLAENDYVRDYERTLAGIGTGLLVLTVGYLSYLAVVRPEVHFHPQFTVIVLGGAALVTAIVWYGVERYAPDLNLGTKTIGAVLLFGHSVDGVANVVGLDWAKELGLPYDLIPKHPVDRTIISLSHEYLPASVLHYTGSAWPFLVVKVVAVLFVIWIFDEEIFEESPRYAILLLVAILAVGLGPGTRDMLRATFGI